jgi:O-antigen/teichoic acid export membrane protein
MNDRTASVYGREIATIAKGAGIVFVGTIIGYGLKYLFEVFVARQIGPELFGVFFLGFTIFSVSEKIATLGLPNGVLRFISLFRGANDPARVKGTIGLSIRAVLISATFICLLILVFSHPLAWHVFHKAELSLVLKFFAVGVVFSALTEILVSSTQAFQIMKYKVLVRMIFEPGFRIVMAIPLFFIGPKLPGVLTAFLMSLVIGTFFAFSFLKKVFPSIHDQVRPVYETKAILSFSWPLFFVGFLNLFIVQINTIMLGHFRTSREVGVYGAAQRTAFLIPIILDSFNAIFAPIIADLYHRQEMKTLEHLFKIVTKWIFSVSFPIFLVFILFGKNILSIWGEQYRTATVCLTLICCAQLINCAVGSVGYVIMMTGKTIINLINNLAIVLLIIVLNYLLIPRFGILGAAASLAIALSIINLVRLIEVYILLRIHPYRIDFYKPLLAGLSAVTASLILSHLFGPNIKNGLFALLGNSSAIALIYILVLLLFGLDPEEKIILNRMKTKFINSRAERGRNDFKG